MKHLFLGSCFAFLFAAMLMPRTVSAAPGDLDPTFGSGGRVRFSLPGASVSLSDFIVQSDGKIVGLGRTPSVVTTLSTHDLFVVRFNSDGTLDTTFNAIGYKMLDFNGGLDLGGSIRQQPDGKLVLVGRSDSGPGNGDFVAIRLNTNGSLDSSFGAAGYAFVDFGGESELAQRVIIQPNGAIVMMGFVTIGAKSDFAFARLTANGALDTTFGVQGKITVDVLGTGASDRPGNFLLLADGTFFAVGGADSYATAIKLTANGILDIALNGTGKITFPLIAPVVSATAVDVAQRVDGSFLVLTVVGTSNAPTPNQLALLRTSGAGGIIWPYALVQPTFVEGAPSFSQNMQPQLAVTSDDKVLIAGSCSFGNSSTNLSVAGFAQTYRSFVVKVSDVLPLSPWIAVFDTTFGSQGVTTIDSGMDSEPSDHLAVRIRLLADGRVIVGGSQNPITNRLGSFFLSQMLNAGAFAGVLGLDAPGNSSPSPGQPGLNGEITVAEGSALSIKVWRTGGSAGAVSVQYSLVGETAVGGIDFVANTGTLNWPDGDRTPRTVPLVTTNDGSFNGVNKTLRVVLSNPTGGAVLATSTAPVSIRNTNAATTPTVGFSSATQEVNEDQVGSSLSFRTIAITRSGDVSAAASIDYTLVADTAQPGADYSAASGTISWAASDTSAKTIALTVLGDHCDEPNKRFTVHLSNPSGAVIAQADLQITIRDADPSPLIEFTQSSLTANESARSVTATVTRAGLSTQPLSVDYIAQAGTAASGDFLPASGTLTWAANDLSSKTIVITLIDDATVESSEGFNIQLSNVTGGAVLGNNSVSVQISDDDVNPTAPPTSPPPSGGTTGTSGTSGSSSNSGGGALPSSVILILLLIGIAARIAKQCRRVS